MYTISQLTNMIGFWLDVLQHHGAAPLLGDSGPYIINVVSKHGMQVENQWNSQYYLEMPFVMLFLWVGIVIHWLLLQVQFQKHITV